MTFARNLHRMRRACAPSARFEFPVRRCCSASPVKPPDRRHKLRAHWNCSSRTSVRKNTLVIVSWSLSKSPPPQPSSACGCVGQPPTRRTSSQSEGGDAGVIHSRSQAQRFSYVPGNHRGPSARPLTSEQRAIYWGWRFYSTFPARGAGVVTQSLQPGGSKVIVTVNSL
jgi:hypothetical protein